MTVAAEPSPFTSGDRQGYLLALSNIHLIVHQLGGLYGSLKGNKQNMYNLNL